MSVGIHISKTSHILEKTKYKSYISAIKTEAELLNMSAISLFIIGPRNKNKNLMVYDIVKKYCKENNIEIWPHASYISSGLWNINNKNRNETKSVAYLKDVRDHLETAKKIDAKGVVFHLPRHSIATVIETMEILSSCHIINSIQKNNEIIPAFTIEMPASRPSDELTYETSSKLNTLVKALIDNTKITLKWNLCIDSCHEFAGGIDFSTQWDKWESGLTNETRDRIQLFHLNGASPKNFGTGKDGHIIPLSKGDAIWGDLISDEFRDYLDRTSIDDINNTNLYDQLSPSELDVIRNSTFNKIAQWCKKKNITMIMEINNGCYKDTKTAMDIINSLIM